MHQEHAVAPTTIDHRSTTRQSGRDLAARCDDSSTAAGTANATAYELDETGRHISVTERVKDFLGRTDIIRALNLPSKAQQLCLKPEEQESLQELKQLLALRPEARDCLKAQLKRQQQVNPIIRKMFSRSSSVYSSRKSSHIDLKQALKELDLYHWKTYQDFLSPYNEGPAPHTAPATPPIPAMPGLDEIPPDKPRGRSRRSSIKHAISKLGMSDAAMPQAPALPFIGVATPVCTGRAPSQRSRSWAGSRRATLKNSRPPSPAPSIHGPSEYVYDEEARAKLRTYLTSSDKFQEALDYGFPSAVHTPKLTESPVIPSPPTFPTRARNVGLNMQSFLPRDSNLDLDNEPLDGGYQPGDCKDLLSDEVPPTEPPRSASEQDVDNFARQLALENAVPVEAPRPRSSDDVFACDFEAREFDINDFEIAIDESQDDRRTPSPASPVTPTTPEDIPLPLSVSTSPSRKSPTSPTHSRGVDSLEECLQRTRSLHHHREGSSGDEREPVSPLSTMVRTAPGMMSDHNFSPLRVRTHHLPNNTMPSAGSGHIDSYCTTGAYQTHPSYERVSPTATYPTNYRFPPSPVSPVSVAPPPPPIPDRRHNIAHVKPLPPRPDEMPISPVSPVSPATPTKASTQHGRVAKNYIYDTQSTFMSPRSPPSIEPAPRQMTLRMTLTRPELRASEEDIYGNSISPSNLALFTRPSRHAKPGASDHKGKDKRHSKQRRFKSQPYDATKPAAAADFNAGVPILGRAKHPHARTTSSTGLAKKQGIKPHIRRTSEIEIVHPSPNSHRTSGDAQRAVFVGRPIVHPDLPAHVLMRSRDDCARAQERTKQAVSHAQSASSRWWEDNVPRDAMKREPNKLRKARTESNITSPVLTSPITMPASLLARSATVMPTAIPEGGELQAGYESHGVGCSGALQQVDYPARFHAGPPQMGAYGPHAGERGVRDGPTLPLHGATCENSSKGKRMWKKMSLSAMRGRPTMVLP